MFDIENITRACVKPGPFIYVVHPKRIERMALQVVQPFVSGAAPDERGGDGVGATRRHGRVTARSSPTTQPVRKMSHVTGERTGHSSFAWLESCRRPISSSAIERAASAVGMDRRQLRLLPLDELETETRALAVPPASRHLSASTETG